MKEQLYLSIPEPCHEDWNKMTPVEQGRHCTVCKKNVVDFTNADDEAIVDFFKNYNGNACGRFNHEQLNRPIEVIELKPASNFLKYAAGLLLPFTFFTSKLHAQKGRIAIKGDTIVKASHLKTMPGNNLLNESCNNTNTRIVIGGAVSAIKIAQIAKDILFITGKVIDEDDSSPLVGVTINLSNAEVHTTTDGSGFFELQITKHQKDKTLILTSVGYQKIELEISNTKRLNGVIDLQNIRMSKNVMGLSEVSVTGMGYRRLGGLTGAVSIVSYSLKDSIANVFKPNAIKTFPNPVAIGGTIQLNFGKTKPGLYQIRLLNGVGQLFYSFQKQISSPNETEQIHLNEKMSAGVYMLQIIDDKKRLVQTSKVVVQ